MKLTRYRAPTPAETEITFPLLECWNPMTKVASIAAQVNGKRVLCRISFDVLRRKFRAAAEEPIRAVVENRSVIEDAARKLIEGDAFEEDGSITIRQRDL